MGKQVHNDVLDGMLNIIKNNATSQLVCSSAPVDRAAALAAALATVVMTGTDFTIADDTSGRKVTSLAKPGVMIDVSGTANHIAYIDGTRLLYVTTCTSQVLTANGVNTVSLPAWKISIADPT